MFGPFRSMIAAAGVRAGRSRGIHYQIGSGSGPTTEKSFRKAVICTIISFFTITGGIVMTVLGKIINYLKSIKVCRKNKCL